MDAKDLRTDSALSVHSNDGSTKFVQGDTAMQCNKNKSYQDNGSNPLAKVDVQTARPCAVIGPDRVVPPSVPTDVYLKRGSVDTWTNLDNIYRHVPEHPYKISDFQHPTRNISPRQTFQENMQRIMVAPTYNTVKMSEDTNYSGERNNALLKNVKPNVSSDTKYCDVPYNVNPIPSDQKCVRNPEVCSNVNPSLARTNPHLWPPTSVNVRPLRPYGGPEVYQYSEYPSCAGPRPMSVIRPHRTGHEDPSQVYSDHYYPDGNVRFKPYPSVKERYAQPRYEYINYSNPFHPPPPFPQHKYDLQKPAPNPYAGYSQMPVKHLENRMGEPILDGYHRPTQQINYSVQFRNQLIQANYMPVPGTPLQNKLYPYPTDGTVKTNKLPYDSKMFADFEGNRNKNYPIPDNYYMNEMVRSHPMKSPVLVPNYPHINMQTIHPHPYYRKESALMKNYDLLSHYRNVDPTLNHLSRFQSQFSPNNVAISPSDSNTSNETIQTQGTSLEDYGYVSQSSTASIRSLNSSNKHIANETYRRHLMRTSSLASKSEMYTNPTKDCKEKRNIDVRQFLQMWNEGEDENGENNTSDNVVAQNSPNNINSFTNQQATNHEQLYVLGLVNVSSEDLSKYEHIQKVSKLPENIKGYNNIELLHEFEEAIELSNKAKLKSTQDYHSSIKSLAKTSVSGVPPRPISPLDVEAKISQSVIHKDVGCNFEIKPCSPKMLNVDVAAPIQSVLNERAIEKVVNPNLDSPVFHKIHESQESCDVAKIQDQTNSLEARIKIFHQINKSQENSNISKHQDQKNSLDAMVTSCKMANNQYISNGPLDSDKNNYSLQDLEGNAGVCLASLPRLDNDIELNFPEVNQQFINANKVETIPSTDFKMTEIFQSTNIPKDTKSDLQKNYVGQKLSSEKECSKLSKYRKLKRKSAEVMNTAELNIQAVRMDSVIIKNPENMKSRDVVALSPNPINTLQNDKDLSSRRVCKYNANEISNIPESIFNEERIPINITVDTAIDFSLNKNISENNNDFSINKNENNIINLNPNFADNKISYNNKNISENNHTMKLILDNTMSDTHEGYDKQEIYQENSTLETSNNVCNLLTMHKVQEDTNKHLKPISDFTSDLCSKKILERSNIFQNDDETSSQVKTNKKEFDDSCEYGECLKTEILNCESSNMDKILFNDQNNSGNTILSEINKKECEIDHSVEFEHKNEENSKIDQEDLEQNNVTVQDMEKFLKNETDVAGAKSYSKKMKFNKEPVFLLCNNDSGESINKKDKKEVENSQDDLLKQNTSMNSLSNSLNLDTNEKPIVSVKYEHIAKELFSPWIQKLYFYNEDAITQPKKIVNVDLEVKREQYEQNSEESQTFQETHVQDMKVNYNTDSSKSLEHVDIIIMEKKEKEQVTDGETGVYKHLNETDIKSDGIHCDALHDPSTTIDVTDKANASLEEELFQETFEEAQVKSNSNTGDNILRDSSQKIQTTDCIGQQSIINNFELQKDESPEISFQTRNDYVKHNELNTDYQVSNELILNVVKSETEVTKTSNDLIPSNNKMLEDVTLVETTSILKKTNGPNEYQFDDSQMKTCDNKCPEENVTNIKKLKTSNENETDGNQLKTCYIGCPEDNVKTELTNNVISGNNDIDENNLDNVSEAVPNIKMSKVESLVETSDIEYDSSKMNKSANCFQIKLNTEKEQYKNKEEDINRPSNHDEDIENIDENNKCILEEQQKSFEIQNAQIPHKRCYALKRSLSDSAIASSTTDLYDESKYRNLNKKPFVISAPAKKKKKCDIVESQFITENICQFIQNNRRNSMSSICNEQNVSFCIFIDNNNCIITEDDEVEKVCYAELEECLTNIHNDAESNDNPLKSTAEVITDEEKEIQCEYSDTFSIKNSEGKPFEELEECLTNIHNDVENNDNSLKSTAEVMSDEEKEIQWEYSDTFSIENSEGKSFEESWVEDVACVETVVSDEVAVDIDINQTLCPNSDALSEYKCQNDELEVFDNTLSEHLDKIKYIYGDKMCSDDAHLVETLYRTPQMNVNKTLINKESQSVDEWKNEYDKNYLVKMLSESLDTKEDIMPETKVSTLSSVLMSDENKSDDLEKKSPPFCKKHSDISFENYNKCHENNIQSSVFYEETQHGSINSCESSTDSALSNNNIGLENSISSSPEVSSTTSEEKNMGILLKITNYKGSRISQINDSNDKSRLYFSENTGLNENVLQTRTKPLITKAAQKYIPPLKETLHDLKVKLPLPHHSLIKLKQLKNSKEQPKLDNSIIKCNNKKDECPKKIKPKFEDVLKSIDEIQFKLHKERSKKSKKNIPKVVIKKNGNGSHYTSTSNKETFSPDLTGRKWQPWVFLEKNNFIDKMALRKKSSAVYNHRKKTFVLSENFQKYKSISRAKFVITQPKSDEASCGKLKYTIRLKHTY